MNNKNWVRKSDYDSAKNLKISAFAVFETILAIAFGIYIWWEFNTLAHFAFSSLFAIFFLLKTKKNEKRALELFMSFTGDIFGIIIGLNIVIVSFVVLIEIINTGNEGSAIALLLLSGVSVIPIIIYQIVIKLIVTIKYFSVESIRYIPRNWFRLVLSTDSFHPIEIMPGIAKTKSIFNFRNLISNENIHEGVWLTMAPYLVVPGTLFLLYTPAITFRYSIKMTAWIYFPFVWLIKRQKVKMFDSKINVLVDGKFQKIGFYYSLAMIIIYSFIPIFLYKSKGLENIFVILVRDFLLNINFYLSDVLVITSSLLTLLLINIFDEVKIYRKDNPTFGNYWAKQAYKFVHIRDTVALASILLMLYNVVIPSLEDFKPIFQMFK